MQDNRNKLIEFFVQKEFTLEKEELSQSFGDYYLIMVSPYFRVMISRDKSFESIDISNLFDENNWYDLGLVKALILNEEKLNEPLPIEASLAFFEEYFDKIKMLFDNKNYKATKDKLEELRRKRVKQMFPRWYK